MKLASFPDHDHRRFGRACGRGGTRPAPAVSRRRDGSLAVRSDALIGLQRQPVAAAAPFRSATAARRLMFPEHTVEWKPCRSAHGGGHPGMRRDLHQGQGTGLPPRAERPAHLDQHPCDPAGRDLHDALHPRSGRDQGRCRVPHLGDHPGRVPHAGRQDGCRRRGRHHGRRLHGRHRAVPDRPLQPRHPDDPRRIDRAASSRWVPRVHAPN